MLLLQLREIVMDYSSDLVVGLGLDAAGKQHVAKHFTDFARNLFTLKVRLWQ